MFVKSILDNKIFRCIFGIIKALLFIILALYVSFVIIQRLSGNSSILGYRLFTVATGSMEPVYNVNDVIIVEDVDEKSLKVGDDIAYRGTRGGFEGLIITHRIIKIDVDENGNNRYFTKGVNSDNPDPSISSSQIIGKVKGKLFFINQVNHVVKNQFGFFFLVFCPLVLVIFLEVAETVIDIKIENNELRKIEKESSSEEVEDEEVI